MPLIHPFDPIVQPDSKILILGSFPSVKSREQAFYYGHPQNRFWKVMAALLHCAVPETVEIKKTMLQQNSIALWDVLRSCEITGSSDASIQNPVANDIAGLVAGTSIQAIFCNGSTAFRIYQTHLSNKPQLPTFKLPSTSPANAQFRLDRLTAVWEAEIKPYLS